MITATARPLLVVALRFVLATFVFLFALRLRLVLLIAAGAVRQRW